jgi:hypothetical protein
MMLHIDLEQNKSTLRSLPLSHVNDKIKMNAVYVIKRYYNLHKTVLQLLNRGYSMLFDEYGIYFTSETGFLIFSRVRSTSENIKILSHE